MERIWVRGTSGSGKSTLARQLASATNVDLIELDSLYHLPGWDHRGEEEFTGLVEEATRGQRWVIDGNYTAVRPLLLDRCDTIVWLDYPFLLVICRIVRRTLLRVIRKELVCNGNRETFFKSFLTKESVIWWAITTHRRRSQQCKELKEKASEWKLEFIHLKSPCEADRFLSDLPAEVR